MYVALVERDSSLLRKLRCGGVGHPKNLRPVGLDVLRPQYAQLHERFGEIVFTHGQNTRSTGSVPLSVDRNLLKRGKMSQEFMKLLEILCPVCGGAFFAALLGQGRNEFRK